MEITVYSGFREVEEDHFNHLMGNLNIERDAYCGGEYYRAKDYPEAFIFGDVPRTVGIHAYGKYYVDPEFFRPSRS